MRRPQNQVAGIRDERRLLSGRCAPQQEHDGIFPQIEQADDMIRECLPSLSAMALRLVVLVHHPLHKHSLFTEIRVHNPFC